MKLKQIKSEVLGNLANQLKNIIENQLKESSHETSWHEQNNDDATAVLKEETLLYLKGKLMEKK